MVELTDAYQAHDNLAGFGSGDGEEAPDRDEEEKNDPFSPYLDPDVGAQPVQANAQAYLSAGKKKGKGKG